MQPHVHRMCSPNSLPKNFKIPSKLTKDLLQNETLKIRQDLKLKKRKQEKKEKKNKKVHLKMRK